MSFKKVLELTAAVRGYRYYRKFWQPKPSQTLNCFYEEDNPFDPFTIKVCEVRKSDFVGHLLREISRATKLFFGLRWESHGHFNKRALLKVPACSRWN